MTNARNAAGWDLEQSPFHPGERAVQERMGVREKIETQGRRTVRRFMPEEHRDFYAGLAYVFVASLDVTGQPWASLLVGETGFLSSPDATTLRVGARPLPGDPLGEILREGTELAALGIDFASRRRNRVIGMAADIDATGFAIRVEQTLGICPRYIQNRSLLGIDQGAAPGLPHRMTALDAAAQAIVAKADTFFVASGNAQASEGITRGADLSHRGGRPGFVRVDDATHLTAPDFIGNFMFNTLGNFNVDPRAGLLFIDFDCGDLLYVAARAEIIWDGPEVEAFAGAQRLIRYSIEQVIRLEGGLPARFSAPDPSALLARTGTWDESVQSHRPQ